MRTITANLTSKYEIKNSKFITILIKIDNNFNLKRTLNQIKEEYPKATHYCYCYRTINLQKSSDDDEPSGTAGIPMLNVLIKEDLINILAVVVRYFGGIKLGAGGLVRAYTTSLTTALKMANLCTLEEGYIVRISTDYSMQKELDYLLKNIEIINKDYGSNITYDIAISKNKLNLLNNYSYKIMKEDWIIKK